MALLVLGRALQALEVARHDLGQEAVQVGEPLGAHAQQPPRAVPAFVDQAGLLEDLQVLRDRGLAHREARGDLRRAHLAAGEQAHDLATLGLGESLEDLHVTYSLYKSLLQSEPQRYLPRGWVRVASPSRGDPSCIDVSSLSSPLSEWRSLQRCSRPAPPGEIPRPSSP